MSSEVCASGMLSFVRQILRETTDYGSLTIRELRNKYMKSMGIASLNPDEKETFRAIVDQAILEHEVEKEEETGKKVEEGEQFKSPVKEEKPKEEILESPLIVKKKIRKMSLSDTDDDKTQAVENSSGDTSILDSLELDRDSQQVDDKSGEIREVSQDKEEKENDDSDGAEFYIKKKKKKRKLKRYSLDKDIGVSNSDSNEKKLTVPRIKLVRDYSMKPKCDSTNDIDEFINSVVKAATGSVDPDLNDIIESNNVAHSNLDTPSKLSQASDRTMSDKINNSETHNDSSLSSTISKVLPSDSDSDTDDQPLSRYRSSDSGNKGGTSYSNADSGKNHTPKPSKKLKRDTSLDSLDGEDSLNAPQKNDENSNATDFSDDDGTLDSSKSRKRKKGGKKETVGNGTKKNSEDHHIQRFRRYFQEAGLRVSYKKLFEGCTTVKAKVQKMKEALEEAGVEGRPTIEKCRKVRKKREREQELASLDKSNIIGTEGRSKRNTRSSYVPPPEDESLSQPSETLQEVKKTFSRLKGIIDSEDSD